MTCVHAGFGALATTRILLDQHGIADGISLGATQIVGGLKTILVKPGHEQEFESLFAQLREQMRQHEPNCLLYSLLKSRTNPRAYIVHEQYRDQGALDAHQSSPRGALIFPKMRALLESITVEYFDAVVV